VVHMLAAGQGFEPQ